MTNRLVDTVLIYRPGGVRGPTVAVDWSEVELEIKHTEGAMMLFVDTSANGGLPARVPAASGIIECFGRLRLMGARLDSLEDSSELVIEDGAQLLNILSIENTLKVSCESTGIAGLAIDYDPAKQQFIYLVRGGRIANTAVQTKSLFQVPDNRTLRLAFEFGAGIITSAQPAMPIVQLGNASELGMFVQDLGTLAQDFVAGPATSSLAIEHDANFSPAPQAGMLGTITLQRSTKQEQIRPNTGGTFNRPTADALTGQMYHDQDLEQPVWWDGTQWRDANGTINPSATPTQSGESVLAVAPAIIGLPVVDQWENFGANGFIGNNGPAFTLAAAGGALTYNGPSGKWYKLSLKVSAVPAGAGPFLYESAIDINGNLLPNLTTPNAAGETLVAGNQQTMALALFAQLNAGDVIRAVVRNRTAAFSLVGIYVQMHAVPIS